MTDLTLGAVLATLDDRPRQLKRALESLTTENLVSKISVVVVSQGSPDRIEATRTIIRNLGMPIVHIVTNPGLSAARNAGVQHLATTFVCFPDDDCRLHQNQVGRLLELLATVKRDETICLPVFGEQSDQPLGHPPSKATKVSPKNCHRSVLSAGLVTPVHVFRSAGGFTETLGLGARSPWTAGEETDYALRILKAGFSVRFNPLKLVVHPDDPIRSINAEVGYGLGLGYACGRNNIPLPVGLSLVGRPLARAARQLLQGNSRDAQQSCVRSITRLAGIVCGLLSREQP